MERLIAGMRGRPPAPEVGDAMPETMLASRNDSLADAPWDAVASAPREPDDGGQREPTRALEVGTVVGRYVVLGKLGAGGMGVVYAAYDPELDRKVALKLLLPGVYRKQRQIRLIREAQALGKLAHPHVVGIYDVGTIGEQVWLAMEFVRGRTLGAWLRTPRRWREVLEVMMSAGEGLMAAHAAGLLHRDFKPDNVMLGDDGRVRVMDFGLARTQPEGESAADERTRPVPNVEALAMELTQAGALVGTPSYMAPEQLAKGKVTAAADQFAFCVVLWEALYGEGPFRGSTAMAHVANVLAGRRRPASKGRVVPSRLRRACERGLALDFAERWPSMEALLEDLRRLVVPRSRRWLAGVGLGLAGVAGFVALRQSGELSEKDEQLTEKEAQLAQRVVELEHKDRRLTTELATQKGLRARKLAEDAGHELEALTLAVEAFEGFDIRATTVPTALLEGLTHALAGTHRGIALRGHDDELTAVAVSPDGQRVATTSEDGTVRLWDAHRGTALRTIESHDGPAHAVAFSPDSARIATAGDEAVRVWNATTAESIEWFPHQGPVWSVAFAPEGKRVATASGAVAWVWHGGTDAIVVPFVGHTGRVRSVAFSPDGTRLLTASEDRTARAWDAHTGAAVHIFAGHLDDVFDLAVSPDGTHLSTASRDETARLWDMATGRPLASLDHGEVVYAVAFSPDGTKLATGTFDDNTASVWDLATRRRATLVRHDDAVVDVAFSPQGHQLVTASRDLTARSWDLASGGALTALPQLRRVDAVAFSPDGSRLVTASGDGSAWVWDVRSKAHLATLRGHRLDVLAVAFSPNGSTFATASWDDSVRLWDARSSTHRVTLHGHTGPVRAVSFSPDDTRVATASQDGTARVWDAATGEELLVSRHEVAVLAVLFDPRGQRLLTVGADDTMRAWSVATGEALASLPHEGPVTAVAFSPDGRRIATAAKDSTVHVWDGESGEAFATLRGHTAPVRALVFSPDGSWIATASADGTARVWSAVTGEQRFAFPHEGPVTSVAFSVNGTHLATASGDPWARLWSLDPSPWLAWACTVLEGRSAHVEASRRVCTSATAGLATSGFEPPLPLVDPMVSSAADVEVPALITVHGVELVHIPGGTFTMGSPPGERGRFNNEGPQHEVTLDDFYLARTPVTNAQYSLYLESDPRAATPALWVDERYNQPNQPVVGLTWYEARAYCDWAGFVLPTEAQWEHAARAETHTAYWYGDGDDDMERFDWCAANTGARERGDEHARARSVATKGGNPWGLFDMHGNVLQWMLDGYEPYTTRARPGDGLRKQPVGEAPRVMRGGSFRNGARGARSAFRDYWHPAGRALSVGFRPALRAR